jgi:formimidoylglutamate deiminase
MYRHIESTGKRDMPTIHARTALLPDGWHENVCVRIGADGRIAEVTADSEPGPDAHAVDVLLPALANLHSHTFQRGMAGLAEVRSPAGRDSFWTWRQLMYRFVDRLEPEDVEAIAAFAFMEMLETGFASVAEFHYLHHRPGGVPYDDPAELSARIVAAAAETGIGLLLLPVFYAQGGVDGRPLAGGQLRFGNDRDSFARLAEGAERVVCRAAADYGFGLAPHSLRAVAPADLQAVVAMRPGGPLHMHIAEQEGEIAETMAAWGARPVAWLLDHIPVDARWCLVHSTHMTEEETARLAASGATAGLCPVTEANLGDGIFAAPAFLAGGGHLGVGTDSNIAISAVSELRQLEYSQRLRDRARVVIAAPGQSCGRRLWELALDGGARALHRDCGALRAGAWADLAALDRESLAASHLEGDEILDAAVFASMAGRVSDLWSAGRHQVHDGCHVRRTQIAARYRHAIGRLRERL